MNEFKPLAYKILKYNRTILETLSKGVPEYEFEDIWYRIWRPINLVVNLGVRNILDIEIGNLK